jgi:heme/copper-type cytochrome/quinol oxidase subunit 2
MTTTMMTTMVVVVVVMTMMMVFSVGVRRKGCRKYVSRYCKTKPSWDEQVFNRAEEVNSKE